MRLSSPQLTTLFEGLEPPQRPIFPAAAIAMAFGHDDMSKAGGEAAIYRQTMVDAGSTAVNQVFINSISTRVPPYEMHGLFDGFAHSLLAERQRRILDRTLKRSGISRRYTVVEPNPESSARRAFDKAGRFALGAFPSTAERMRIYECEAARLAVDTVRQLDEPLDTTTHLIVCSCTGMAAPGVDLQLIEALGLPGSTERTIVGFMGCYAAINALRLARSIVRSEPEARVLVVAVELCSLHMQETADMERLLGFMIFGDGCAAAFVSAEPRGLRLDGFRTAITPVARDLITWHVGDAGFDMVLSPRVPSALADAVPRAVAEIVPEGTGAIDMWAIHPGGKAILDAVARGLALPDDALDASRFVLDNYGNMSSPSVLFVLAELTRRGLTPGGRGLALAFGPGLTAEGMRYSVPQ